MGPQVVGITNHGTTRDEKAANSATPCHQWGNEYYNDMAENLSKMSSFLSMLYDWFSLSGGMRDHHHFIPLQWRHNECDGVSNHRRLDRLLNRLFRHRSKKTSKLRVSGLCEGNPPVAGGFPSQRAGNAEDVSIWWHHHAFEWLFPMYTGSTLGHQLSSRCSDKTWRCLAINRHSDDCQARYVVFNVSLVPGYLFVTNYRYSKWLTGSRAIPRHIECLENTIDANMEHCNKISKWSETNWQWNPSMDIRIENFGRVF